MNPLESLKQKLQIKPNFEERKQVSVIIKGNFINEIDQEYDIQPLLQKLIENKLTKVTIKPQSRKTIEIEQAQPIEKAKQKEKTKITKIPARKLIIQQDADEAKENPPALLEGEEGEVVKRKTTKIKAGPVVLGTETLVMIGDTPLNERLPVKQQPFNIIASSYYMNNREKFVNFINSLFSRYRERLQENTENISCESIGKNSGDFSLLIHQEIVRDYMNLYTPYRGLLLYHGLGSGKTCTSIAIAEGMKDNKQIIIMTPKSLRSNYMAELKKCGDFMYKKNQFWEWISTETNPQAIQTLSTVLRLPIDYITTNKGAWLVNVTKPPNYSTLSSNDKKVLDNQLDVMISSKYRFINYNGLRLKKLEEYTSGFTKNLFDNAVVIIDEAHNLISRIVNKIKRDPPTSENVKGVKETSPKFLSTRLYEYLLSASNARIVLLTGTPVINYPNEFGILFNILRGYIKTWKITLDIETNNNKTFTKIDKNSLQQMLIGEKSLDYLDYSPSSKILTITRNPFGFKNKIKTDTGYKGVTNAVETKNDGLNLIPEGDFISDNDFERKIISILKRNNINVLPVGVKVELNKALPDSFDLFEGQYIDSVTKKLKNTNALKRRIIGLSSYFRSAQESLLPRFTNTIGLDYHIVRIPMSDFQFNIYESARKEERKVEKNSKQTGIGSLYKDTSSTYKIFSRLFCNFVMPNRPYPDKKKKDKQPGEGGEEEEADGPIQTLLKEAKKQEAKDDMDNEVTGEVEGDEVLDTIGGIPYKERIDAAIKFIKEHSNDFLTVEALTTYSPKYLHILENIKDPEHVGLHLVYSQFRTLEGIGVFTLVMEKNGFARFKIKKNSLDAWEIDIKEEDLGKPTYTLYTGTETPEEKEIILNIYNSEWDYIPTNIANELRAKSNNNNMGEIIKCLMITSSGSEGINLRNTRYVHIMEPYWHPVRLEQVIGRARRICSHKDLPLALQTVEVFVYLMIFSTQQLNSDASIELKRKDLSKISKLPVTSDQLLYEISEIKGNLTRQLTDSIKESAFDCNLYSNGKCISFADPNSSKFSFEPEYANQQDDTLYEGNKTTIEWKGKPITIGGVDYVYKRVGKNMLNIYDKASYMEALKTPGVDPVLVGTLETNEKGEQVFKPVA